MKNLAIFSVLLVLFLNTAIAAPIKFREDWKDALLVAVQSKLKSPDSARLRVPDRIPEEIMICGWVNAKNSYGGYTGEQPFMAFIMDATDKETGKIGFIAVMPTIGSTEPTARAVLKSCDDKGFSYDVMRLAEIEIIASP